jgi:aminoglycoside phosphotransferase family enzyme/predicted kinase
VAGELDQRDLIAFLSGPAAYNAGTARVEHLTTHISHIFLAVDRAYKLKRAVHLPYVDFSTLALRHAACQRELKLNRRTAPELYLRISAVTRTHDGGFALDGTGEVVDWLVVMRRFDQEFLLDRLVGKGGLAPATLRALGDEIATFHSGAEAAFNGGGAAAIAALIDGLNEAFAVLPPDVFDEAGTARLLTSLRAALDAVASLLDKRRDQGKVRHCHGDLHLNNICLIGDRPLLFDCIEFNDTLGTIDVLYDLAFLLMDLIHRGLPGDANTVFNRYLDRASEDDGTAAMPLFLALRAAIRAHVTASNDGEPDRLSKARSYFALAQRCLEPWPPSLVVIGGLSGTGKSTLAYRLAPNLGAGPGARVLRSDVIRKRLFGLAPETRLDARAYQVDVTMRVYTRLMEDAAVLLASGQTVIVDAVFARPEERAAIRAVAASANLPFYGFWLEAPAAILEKRVSNRRGDASDADVSILRGQLAFDVGKIDWQRLVVSGSADDVLSMALRAIA